MLLTERRRLVGFVCASLVLGMAGGCPWAEERPPEVRSAAGPGCILPPPPPPSAIDMDAVEACLGNGGVPVEMPLAFTLSDDGHVLGVEFGVPIDSAVATCMYQGAESCRVLALELDRVACRWRPAKKAEFVLFHRGTN
jgi:hypothetical protein